MRASSFVFAAVAGVAVGFLGAPGANAMTGTSPAGVRVATEAMDTSALVHCRPYRHWHRWEHRWTHGCHGGVGVGVEADVVVRRGHHVRVHEGSRVRGEIRSGSTTTRERTTIRSGTSTSTSGQTTTKSGTSGGSTTGRGQGGEKSSTGGSIGGSSSGPAGGTSGTQSGVPKQ